MMSIARVWRQPVTRACEAANAIDAECIAAAGRGERGALERFGRAWLSPLRRWFARRWGHSTLRCLVDDGVQEVMFECCRPHGALARFDAGRGAACAAFLRGVAWNVAARIERQEARRAARCRALGATMILAIAPGPNADSARVAREQLAAARTSLACAENGGPRLAEVVRLNFDDGLSVRDIARRWGLPAPQVHVLRRRALRVLRRQLLCSGVA